MLEQLWIDNALNSPVAFDKIVLPRSVFVHLLELLDAYDEAFNETLQ